MDHAVAPLQPLHQPGAKDIDASHVVDLYDFVTSGLKRLNNMPADEA
jgi:hypothetical protein